MNQAEHFLWQVDDHVMNIQSVPIYICVNQVLSVI